MQKLLLFLNIVGFFIWNWPPWSFGHVLFYSSTSFEGEFRGGQPLNIFTWFIGAGGLPRKYRRIIISGTNRICCRCRVFCLFSVKVCPWYKNQKNSQKTGNHAGVRYVPKLSVQEISIRVVPVSLRVFSGHKTMIYTMKVGSTTFTNMRRHRGLDFYWIFNSRVDIYTLSSTVKDGDYRLIEIRILKSGRRYQPKLIINIISQR